MSNNQKCCGKCLRIEGENDDPYEFCDLEYTCECHTEQKEIMEDINVLNKKVNEIDYSKLGDVVIKDHSPEVGNMREEKKEICQCETWGGDRGCIECVKKEKHPLDCFCATCERTNELHNNKCQCDRCSSTIQPETWEEKEMQQWDNLDCNEPVEKRMRDANLNGDQRYEIADYWIARLRSLLATQKEEMAKKIEAMKRDTSLVPKRSVDYQVKCAGCGLQEDCECGGYNEAIVDAIKVLRGEGEKK